MLISTVTAILSPGNSLRSPSHGASINSPYALPKLLKKLLGICPDTSTADMAEENLIPVVDLSAFDTEGNTGSRLEPARALYKACHDLGFVQILGHGVEPELLREAFDWSKKLYSLPHDEKMKAPHPDGPMPHRGSSCCDWCYLLKAKISRLLPSGAREGVLRGRNGQQRRNRNGWRLT